MDSESFLCRIRKVYIKYVNFTSEWFLISLNLHFQHIIAFIMIDLNILWILQQNNIVYWNFNLRI